MKEFEDYQKAHQELLSMFDNDPPEYSAISSLLHVKWEYSDYCIRWEDGGEDYSDDVISVHEGKECMMFFVRNCFGDKELVIFDKEKELV